MRLRARKTVSAGRFLRANFTLRSVTAFLRDVTTDGHVDGTRPWSSLSIGPRGFAWNSRSRRVRADLPGPFYAESDPIGTPRPALTAAGTPRDGQHCRHWYDEPETPCCRCGYNGPDETACPGEPLDYRPPTPVTDEEAEAQDCPRCGAEPDGPCRTATTGDPTEPHAARKAAARAALTEGTDQP